MTDRLPVRASLRFLAIAALVAVPLACGGGGNSSGTGGSGGGGHATGGTVGHTGGSGGGTGLGGAAGSAGGAAGGQAGGTAGGGGSVGGGGGRNVGGSGGTGGGAGARATGGAGGGSAGAGGSAGGAAGGTSGAAGGAAGGTSGAAGGTAGGAGGASGAAGTGAAGNGGAGGTVALPAGNLIVNGDAEAAVGSTDGTPVTTPGWTVTGDATAMQYGQGDYPAASDPGPTDRGSNLFIGGYKDDLSTFTQTIDVSVYAAALDTGVVKVTLSGYLGGYSDQGDNAVLSATFQNAGGQALGAAVTIGPVTAADRSDTTGLLSRSQQATVPVGTRKIVVVLTMTKTVGYANDGYADNLSLTF